MLFTFPPEHREIGFLAAYLRTLEALVAAKKGDSKVKILDDLAAWVLETICRFIVCLCYLAVIILVLVALAALLGA